MATKKSKRGGYRPGAGAKKTGRNTTCISFSVHKDYAELIKSMVKSKIIELKQSQNQSKPQETCMEGAKRIAASPSFKKVAANRAVRKDPVSDYLKSRRSKKLGLKE